MMERLKARGLLWSALLGLAVGSTACSNSQPPLGDFMQTAAEQFASLSVQAAMDSPVGVDAADVVRREDCLGFYAKVELGDRDVQPLVILPTKQKWFAVGADCRSRETGEEYTAALDIHVERTIEGYDLLYYGALTRGGSKEVDCLLEAKATLSGDGQLIAFQEASFCGDPLELYDVTLPVPDVSFP